MCRVFLGAGFACALLASVTQSAFAQERTFGGYDCTKDCSGHKAGYDWAAEHNIISERDCDGDSQSFIEGCQAYVEDPSRGSDFDDEGNPIE